VKIQPLRRDFQAEGESPAVGLFLGAAFSTALLPTISAKEPKKRPSMKIQTQNRSVTAIFSTLTKSRRNADNDQPAKWSGVPERISTHKKSAVRRKPLAGEIGTVI